MKKVKNVIIVSDIERLNKQREATGILEMYSHYNDKIREFNNFNRIVNHVSGFQTNDNISTDIPVNIEMFDKLYQGAMLLNLLIDMTFNYDTELWYLTIRYKGSDLCFTNRHESLKADN